MRIKFIYSSMVILLILILANCQNVGKITESVPEDTTNHIDPHVRKPNLYIYPEDEINLTVTLNFPNGGGIIESIPEYGTGWNVNVQPSGLIDNQYEYLFYEAQIPQLLQRGFGWKVSGIKLESFFTNNLTLLRFSQKEIKDFADYWIPLLDLNKEYVIYPQFNEQLKDIIQINTSLVPHNLIRVWYVIDEFKANVEFEVPVIPNFQRQGFVILEWGVVY
jgi:hypothetical protein